MAQLSLIGNSLGCLNLQRMKTVKDKPYRAYLIRCWHVDPESHPNGNAWRFSLESVDGRGKRYGFTDPAELLQFLTTEIEKGTMKLVTDVQSGNLPFDD